jgi:hypothetical protein
MRDPSRVEYDFMTREHYVVLVLDIEEAEWIADALGPNDGGARDILELVTEARHRDDLRSASVSAGGDRD